MFYYKNFELARIFSVSDQAVRNWIDAARRNKLDLALHQQDGKWYIANTAANLATIEDIVQKRKKYINTRGRKVLTPKPEFYKLYSPHQLLHIITSLENYRELPHRYTYFGAGAHYWDTYANRLWHETLPNILTSTIKLLELSYPYLDSRLQGYGGVHVIDLGVGNGLPVKGLLAHLLEANLLQRYSGVDLSEAMLKIAMKNIKSWFGDKAPLDSHVRDLTYDRFSDLILGDYFRTDDNRLLSLMTLFGGTIANLREPDQALQVIRRSMNRDSVLIYAKKLDTENSRRFFDFSAGAKVEALGDQDRFMLDLLNIDPSLYEVEHIYDQEQRARSIRVKMKVAVVITFTTDAGTRTIVLNKDDAILLWRSWQQTSLDVITQFDRNGFDILQTSKTADDEYLLLIAGIKTAA